MQQDVTYAPVTLITPEAPMTSAIHGGRAKCLQRLVRLGLPVPTTVALSFSAVRRLASGDIPDIETICEPFGPAPLLSVRPSSQDPDWGGPGAILNIGMCDAKHAALCDEIGPEAATALYLRFIVSYATHVARLDSDMFDLPKAADAATLALALRTYEDEADEPFPQDVQQQLVGVLRSMAQAWEGTTARLLRKAKGAPEGAGLGLVVQSMALGMGRGHCGSGVIHFIDPATGERSIRGRYKEQSQAREALTGPSMYLQRDPRGPSLEDSSPEAFAELQVMGQRCRRRLREEMQIVFAIDNGRLSILDAIRVPRASRASVRVAVDLAEDGVISSEEAVMRVDASSLSELLHRQVAPGAERDVVARGIAASPGAATGKIVFSAQDAQACAARGEDCILVRRETTPEDIRGMHASVAVITMRGGITSHAAVIGRGLGLPCVVGASTLQVDLKRNCLIAPDGRQFGEGEMICVDGTSGEILVGEPEMIEAALDGAFQRLLSWADEARDIGVRANADTPADAQTAKNFAAEGIGLCRTEHMFFEGERLSVMREMIFADQAGEDRASVLARLLPMQRGDFIELFKIMAGKPVCIRLFDPPLHEFLPADRAGMRELAQVLDRPLSEVIRRIEAMEEYNPMLGLRGVRLGVTVPEIYEMQARAIFEATIAASRKGAPVVPEIMIPLVSAMREVELVKNRIDAIAVNVHNETGADFDYRLGVMVETPRAALRAADIAEYAHFLSFGTNDLTQMTYGLSRDDAGRFMQSYVRARVYPEDPFLTLDLEGVGELVSIGAGRGRAARPDITLSICGEHGGSREAIAFCRERGFDYVSCSPFRVPLARLSAGQLAIEDRQKSGEFTLPQH